MFFTIPLTQQLYEASNQKDEHQRLIEDEEEKEVAEKKKVSVFETFKKMSVNLLSVCFVFLVTMSMFPGLFMGSTYDEKNLDQSTTLLLLSMCYMIGDLLSRLCVYIPIKWNKWIIFILTIARIVFAVPVFIYYFGVYSEPILMLFIMLLYSFTNGYFSAVGINLAYASISPEEMKVGGNFVMVFMNGGLSLGGTILFFLNYFLSDLRN